MSSRIAAFGELLWDLLPEGPALGGAPYNFGYRMSELGHEVAMISAVGNDELGDDAVAAAEEMGMDTRYIQRKSDYPTGTVEITFDELGEPDYTIIQDVAYDHIAYEPALDALADAVDCVCFGTLAQRSTQSRETLSTFLDRAETNPDLVRFLDINLRRDCHDRSTIEGSLERADILKVNEAEARMLADLYDIDSEALADIGHGLAAKWMLDYWVITCGPRGAVCAGPGGEAVYSPGYDVDVVDPCGAGDAFSAGFLHEIIAGSRIEGACRAGNLRGAAVARQRSATQPVTAEAIRRLEEGSADRVHDSTIDF